VDFSNNSKIIWFVIKDSLNLHFTVYDNNGAIANISGATITWKMSPYGKENIISLSYGTTLTSTSEFEVYLLSADTLSLKGKYVHQYTSSLPSS